MDDAAPTPDLEWIEAQLDARGLSKSDCGRLLGEATAGKAMHPNVLGRLLTGGRRLQIDEAIALARILAAPRPELIRRFGYNWPEPCCNVIGRVDGRGRVSMLPPDLHTTTAAPIDADASLTVLRVEAAHTRLAIYHGYLLFYEPSRDVRTDAFGRLAVIDVGDEPAPIVGVLDRGSYGRGSVTIFGGLDVLEAARIVSAAPVKWLRAT